MELMHGHAAVLLLKLCHRRDKDKSCSYFNGEKREADKGTKQIKKEKKVLRNETGKKYISC
jgi:hypothetical protein